MNSRRQAGGCRSQIWLLIFLVSLFRRGRICYHFNCSSLSWETGWPTNKNERKTSWRFTRLAATPAAAEPPCCASLCYCMSKAADAPRQICSSRTRELVWKTFFPFSAAHISRKHFKLIRTDIDGKIYWSIEDINSSMGTYLNGYRINEKLSKYIFITFQFKWFVLFGRWQ